MKIPILETLFRPKETTLKAVGTGEGFHLDDDGKYLIFRTIRGKVVPIEISPEEALEYAREQGVDVDPASQEALRQKQDELEYLSNIAEAYGPEGQAQAEQALAQQAQQQQVSVQQQAAIQAQQQQQQPQQPQQQAQQPQQPPTEQERAYTKLRQARQDFRKLSEPVHEKLLVKEAAKMGITPEQLKQQRQQQYEASKKDMVKRSELPDKGWDSLISHQVGTIISRSNFAEKSGQWYTMQAYDLMLRKGLDMAMAGSNPSEVSLKDLVASELRDYSALRKNLEHYEGFKADENDYSVEANIARGVKWLQDNLVNNPESEASKFLDDYFNTVYDKMYNEFNPEADNDFEPVDIATDLGIPVKQIPAELPKTFSGKEATAVKTFHNKIGQKGSRWSADRQASMHTIARTFDSIPVEERAKAVGELTNANRGVHPTHKRSFDRAIEDITKHDMDVDVDAEIDSILRIGARAAKGTTEEKIKAIQQMSGHMGRIDAQRTMNLVKGKYSGGALTRKVNDLWNQTAINGGGVGGEGPEILGVLLDDDRRRASIISNKNLKLMSGGGTGKRGSNIEIPKEAQVAMKQKAEEASNRPTLPEGWSQSKGVITTDDGYQITIDGANKKWAITSPTGESVADINMSRGMKPGMSIEDKAKVFNGAISQAQSRIAEHKGQAGDETSVEEPSETPTQETTPAEKPAAKKPKAKNTKTGLPGQMFGFSKAKVTNKDRQALDGLAQTINESGGKITPKVNGLIYQVTNANGESFDVAYDARDNQFKFFSGTDPIHIDTAMNMAKGSAAPRDLTKEEKDAARPPAERAVMEVVNEIAKNKGKLPTSDTTRPPTEAVTPEQEETKPEEVIPPENKEQQPEPEATQEVPQAEPLKVSDKFSSQLDDTGKQQLQELSNYAAKYNFKLDNVTDKGFTLTSPDGTQVNFGKEKDSGGLRFVHTGPKDKVQSYNAKDVFERFAPDDFHEPVKVNEDTEDNKRRRQPKDAWKEKLPRVRKPNNPIEWNEEEYGPDKFSATGKPTGGYIRWHLHNQGYSDKVLSQLPDNVRNPLIKATEEELSVDDPVVRQMLMEEGELKSVTPIRNFIQSFFVRKG